MEGPHDRDNLHNRTRYWKANYILGNVTEEKKENCMEIKRSSWHYRLFKKYNRASEPASLCPYFRTVVCSLVMVVFEFLVARPFLFAIDHTVFFLGLGASWIAVTKGYELYTAGRLATELYNVGMAFSCAAGLLSVMCISLWMMFRLHDTVPAGFKWLKERDTYKLCYGYYRAVKDKVCPLITVVD